MKKRALVCNFMRDFGRLYARCLFVNHSKNNRCEIRAFFQKNMHVFFNLICEIAHRAAQTLSLILKNKTIHNLVPETHSPSGELDLTLNDLNVTLSVIYVSGK